MFALTFIDQYGLQKFIEFKKNAVFSLDDDVEEETVNDTSAAQPGHGEVIPFKPHFRK